MHITTEDLTGLRVGRLLVLRENHGRPTRYQQRHWDCQCDCGKAVTVPQYHLKRREARRSCGCLRRDTIRKIGTTHGRSNTAMYRVWRAMLNRCYNPHVHAYARYGGRGIGVCDRWRNDFVAYLDDIGEPPAAGYSLDRIDNDGDYSPDNVRWAPVLTQANNTRSNHFVEVGGVTMTIAEWSRHTGIPAAAITKRLKRGWAPAEAVECPLKGRATQPTCRA